MNRIKKLSIFLFSAPAAKAAVKSASLRANPNFSWFYIYLFFNMRTFISAHLWWDYICTAGRAVDEGSFIIVVVCDWFENTNSRKSWMQNYNTNFMFYNFLGDHVSLSIHCQLLLYSRLRLLPLIGSRSSCHPVIRG